MGNVQDEASIPIDNASGLANWDSPDAINWHKFERVVKYTKENFCLPQDHVSLEPEHEIMALSGKDWSKHDRKRKLVIVEGFLLFDNLERPLNNMFDLRIMLHGTYDELKTRRQGREGYITAAGLWQDPPGYFDHIVWPMYIKSHQHLYIGGDIEHGKLHSGTNLHMPPPTASSPDELFGWAMQLIDTYLGVL